tara:strand:- start:273 stop:1061 length:789 start_codon:yes stop_codon:yes gene_type:complete
MKSNNNFISVLITNFNKSKYLKKSLGSLKNQNYKNYEIIFFDDKSTDQSLKIVKKIKKARIIKNLIKKSSAPLNQINGVDKAFKRSKGNIICLMDADDFFFKNKLLSISKFFDENKEKNIVFNYPKISKREKFIFRQKKSKNIWPTIFPTSCISIRRNTFKSIMKNIEKNRFDRLEIDTRVCIYSNFFLNEYNILKKNLTIYNYDPNGIMAKIPKYSKLWWIRRDQAFGYLKLLLKKRKVKFKFSYDYYITLTISFILRKVL